MLEFTSPTKVTIDPTTITILEKEGRIEVIYTEKEASKKPPQETWKAQAEILPNLIRRLRHEFAYRLSQRKQVIQSGE